MHTSPSRPGWYVDQHDAGFEQFWDGERWTGEVRPIAQPAGDTRIIRVVLTVTTVATVSAMIIALLAMFV